MTGKWAVNGQPVKGVLLNEPTRIVFEDLDPSPASLSLARTGKRLSATPGERKD